MKVKNEYIEIKNGNKTYIRKNMILNTYLYDLFKSQLETGHTAPAIKQCFIKFDTPIENVDYDTELTQDDFDIIYFTPNYIGEDNFKKISELNKNSIKIRYHFGQGTFLNNHDYKYYEANDFAMFNGRQITAIGFGMAGMVYAFLDTSNMNIIVNGNENISIVRVDKFESDGICYGIDYPLHLVNVPAEKDKTSLGIGLGYVQTMAQLYSVGFGNTLGLMEEEHLISEVEVDRDDTSITFDLSRIKKVGHYPSENLQLGFYPTMDNSKYLIFKYRLYRQDQQLNVTYLDEYYTMSMPNENFGNLEIKLKIERS